MSTVIKVENVSKLYRLGEVGTGSLAHDVNRWWHKMRGNEDPYLKIGQVNDRTKPVGRGGLAAPTLPPEGEMPLGVQNPAPSDNSSPTSSPPPDPRSHLSSDLRPPTSDLRPPDIRLFFHGQLTPDN